MREDKINDKREGKPKMQKEITDAFEVGWREPAKTVRLILPEQHGPTVKRLVEVFEREVKERCAVKIITKAGGRAELTIKLDIRNDIGKDGFAICNGADGAIVITGNDERGLVYGVGRLLHSSRYDDRGLSVSKWSGTSLPKMPVRGLYFTSHYHNYYHDGDIEEIQHYLENLVLWGMNSLLLLYHPMHFHSYGDPDAVEFRKRLHRCYKTAERMGIECGLMMCVNDVYLDSAEGKGLAVTGLREYEMYRRLACPSKPGGMDFILKGHEDLLKGFADDGIALSHLMLWGNDDGGCECEQCKPWAVNGYMKTADEIVKMAKRIMPAIEMISMSGWGLDGEGLWMPYLEKHKPSWLTHLVWVDGVSETLAKQGVAGLDFPEISMNMRPWGAYGANANPDAIAKGRHKGMGAYGHNANPDNYSNASYVGGFPYSEGRHEDMDKIACLRHYWEGNTLTGNAIINEYVSYYFLPDMVADMTKVVALMEKNQQDGLYKINADAEIQIVGKYKQIKDENAEKAQVFGLERTLGKEVVGNYDLLKKLDARLPEKIRTSWRWRAFYLRGIIDNELYMNKGRIDGEVVREMLDEMKMVGGLIHQ